MSNFKDWCNEAESSVSTHKLRRLSADPAKQAHAVEVIAKAVPEYYAAPSRVAGLLKKLGKAAAAKFVEESFQLYPRSSRATSVRFSATPT